MSTIWFPVPVMLFFRRLFNIAWTFSLISRSNQHALQLQGTAVSADGQSGGRSIVHDDSRPSLWEALRLAGSPSWTRMQAYSDETPNLGDSNSSSKPASSDTRFPSLESDTRNDVIHQLMNNPVLHDPLRRPRYPIALCHGMFTAPPIHG